MRVIEPKGSIRVAIDLQVLKIGDRLRTVDGDIAEIIEPSADGKWVKVKYIDAHDDRSLVGSEDLCEKERVRRDSALVSEGNWYQLSGAPEQYEGSRGYPALLRLGAIATIATL